MNWLLSALVPFAVAPVLAENPALAPIEAVAGLPRVLIIGDSISIGYTIPVREQLEAVANVHRTPINGGPTSRGFSRSVLQARGVGFSG